VEQQIPDKGQGGDAIAKYAAKLPACRKRKVNGTGGRETPGGKKEYPIEDEGFNKSGYGYSPF
jgi:hypothetical protein